MNNLINRKFNKLNFLYLTATYTHLLQRLTAPWKRAQIQFDNTLKWPLQHTSRDDKSFRLNVREIQSWLYAFKLHRSIKSSCSVERNCRSKSCGNKIALQKSTDIIFRILPNITYPSLFLSLSSSSLVSSLFSSIGSSLSSDVPFLLSLSSSSPVFSSSSSFVPT